MKKSLTHLAAAALAATVTLGSMFAYGQGLGITGLMDEYRNSIFQVGILRMSRETAIVAHAGGGQTAAYQLTYSLNRVATVASANDSVKLPICQGGKVVIVINAAASNSMNVYGQTGETINALSANSAFAVAANKFVIFACGIDGAWYTNLTA